MGKKDSDSTIESNLALVAAFEKRLEKLACAWGASHRRAHEGAAEEQAIFASCGDDDEKKAKLQAMWARQKKSAELWMRDAQQDVENTVEPIIALCEERGIYSGSLLRYTFGDPFEQNLELIDRDRRSLEQLANALRQEKAQRAIQRIQMKLGESADEKPKRNRLRNPGRPPLSAAEARKRKEILKDLKKAKKAGISQKEFCKKRNITPNELKICLDWAYRRRKRKAH